jgi:hypothetical protein
MHLQLNLSNQLAKQWKTPLSDAPPETHPLLRWRIDKIKLGRTTANYICVNEASLFSFVLANAAGMKAPKLQQMFVTRLLYILEYYHFPEEAQESFNHLAVLFGKTQSSKIIGSVTSIRHSYNVHYEYSQVPQVVAEQRVNSGPLQTFSFGTPFEGFMALRNEFADRNNRRLSFTLPKELRWCAHDNLHDRFTFPLFCFSNEQETAQVPVEDLILLHEGTLEALELNQTRSEHLFQLTRLSNLLMDTIEKFLKETDRI